MDPKLGQARKARHKCTVFEAQNAVEAQIELQRTAGADKHAKTSRQAGSCGESVAGYIQKLDGVRAAAGRVPGAPPL